MNELNILNGLNTVQMTETIAAIKERPEIAAFRFRANNEWLSGGENRSTIQGFYGAGQEDTSRTKPFIYLGSEPPVLFGTNQAANAGEFLLHALAGCITTTFVMHATARGIRVDEISTSLEGDVDLQGALALDPSVTPAFTEIRVKMNVRADCSDEEINELLDFSKEHSALTQTISQPVRVKVERGS
jgi:uncharacterized OsmC-like protein